MVHPSLFAGDVFVVTMTLATDEMKLDSQAIRVIADTATNAARAFLFVVQHC
jgi:hypothetical protein